MEPALSVSRVAYEQRTLYGALVVTLAMLLRLINRRFIIIIIIITIIIFLLWLIRIAN